MRVGWQPRIPVFVTDLDMISINIKASFRCIDLTIREVEPRPMMWLVWDEEE